VTIDGVDFTEQLQVVGVDGGIAANVVPDVATVVLNFRYAPDRDPEGATAWLIDFLGAILEEGDDFDVLDNAPSAAPAVSTKLVQGLVAATGSEPMAKVGWTDVATFTGFGVPATNFGAGNPLLAHSPDECITAQEVDAYYERLSAWL
jgi:succinyl-diaminopimelate desuccinylase